MNAVGDLQGGIEEAERLLGYKVIITGEATTAEMPS
jgi:rsbT co-antagonist protein RsbR